MSRPAFELAGAMEPKRFLFTCWPFVGHVYQQMGIAHALHDRGHRVAFYTGERFRRLVENEGFTVFPFQHIDEDHAAKMTETLESYGPKLRGGPRSVIRVLRELMAETIPAQMDDLGPILTEWCPDVIVADATMLAPIVVLWEKTGIPVALSSTFMGPLIPGPDAPPWGIGLPPPRSYLERAVAFVYSRGSHLGGAGIRRRLDAIRASYGLGPLKCTVNEYTGQLPLYLVGNIPELDYDRHDLPSSVAYVGSCVWNRPTGAESPDWLDRLPTNQPWVHVTESTLRNNHPFLLHAAARGLANQPYQVILTTGTQRDPTTLDFEPHASNIYLRQWVSHADLLHRCSVVVTSGGAGTIIASLQVGVPLVVVPTAFDKPDNARRVVEAGVGVMLSPRRCTPERLRAAVEEVLNNPRYRNNAAKIAQRFAEAPGPMGAAESLENLAINAPLGRGGNSPPVRSANGFDHVLGQTEAVGFRVTLPGGDH